MLPVAHFQSAEISFQSVGGVRDAGMFEEVKHLGQGVDQQAACALEIAEHPAVTGCQGDFPALALFPSNELIDPAVAGDRGTDRCEFLEQPPQVLRIGACGPPATPHQPLALDMYKAALKDCLGPTLPQGLQQPWLTVGGDTERVQPLPRQVCAIRPHDRGRLVDTQLPGNHGVGDGIHEHGQRPAASAQIGRVDD